MCGNLPTWCRSLPRVWTLLWATVVAIGLAVPVGASASAYSDEVSGTSGLVSYWRLNETSGSTFVDSEGLNDATISGGLTLGVTGALATDSDPAASFDGTNDYASAPLDLSGTNQATVEFWLKWDAFSGNDDLALEHTPNFNSVDGGILVDPNSSEEGKFAVTIRLGGQYNNVSFTRPSAGVWHHYAFVLDGTAAGASRITPYVDGAPVSYTKLSSGAGTGTFADSTLYFMSRGGASLFGSGDLDELAVYDAPLSSTTIADHYEAGAGPPANQAPTGAFDATPARALTGQEVDFDASDSTDSDGEVVKYEWDLDGNGSFETDTGTSPLASRTYTGPGSVPVKLRVTDDGDETDEVSHSLRVTEGATSDYADAVLGTASLRHYWRLGESGGGVFGDSEGAADAAAVGTPMFGAAGALPGDVSDAALFDGSSDSATAELDLSDTQKLTVEFWLSWDAFASNDDLALEYTSNFNSNDGGFLVDPNSDISSKFAVSLGRNSSRNVALFPRPSAAVWHHYALVLDTTAAGADQILVYVDGAPVTVDKFANGTGAGAFADSTLHFMSRNAASLFGAGGMDELAIYGQALSAGTIADHFEAAAVEAPEAAFDVTPSPALTGQQVAVDGSDSTDVDGEIVKYEWDLDGNGSYETDTGTTPTTTHTYSSVGTVTVRLRVTDDDGLTATTSKQLHVNGPGAGYAAKVLATAGLAHYWRLGETSGTTLADAKGEADATIAGAPTLGATGALVDDDDTAASFDGTDDSATADVDLSATNRVTVEFWLKWDAFAANDDLAIELTPNFNDHDGGFIVDPNCGLGTNRFCVSLGRGASRNVAMFDRPSPGDWHHYALVLDTTAPGADQIVPYVDGEPVAYTKWANGTGAGAFADSTLNVMSRNNASLFGGGDLDELALYTRPLAASEIEDHHEVGIDPPEPYDVSIDVDPDQAARLWAVVEGWTSSQPVTFAYQWQLCDASGENCEDASGESRDRVFEVPVLDDDMKVRVVARATIDSTPEAVASEVVVVHPSAPVSDERPLVSGTARQGRLLTVEGMTGWDRPGLTVTYQWRRCEADGDDCDDIAGATGTSYGVTSADVGSTLRVAITGTNGGGSRTISSYATPVVSGSAVVNTAAPTISRGAGDRGDVLAASPGTWTGSGAIDYAYRWQRCDADGANCVDIGTVPSDRYELRSADVGARLRVRVRGTNAGGSDHVLSAPTAVIESAAPANASLPRVIGEAFAPGVLVAEGGAWTGIGPHALGYQWLRCDAEGDDCAPVVGATDPEYATTPADLGATLRVTVTPTNEAGQAVESSVATAEVATAPDDPLVGPELIAAPSIVGETEIGEELTALGGTWSPTGDLALSYRWLRCDSAGQECEEVDGADGQAYELDANDLGTTLAVTVTARDDTGATQAWAVTAQSVRVIGGPANDELPEVTGIAKEGELLTADPGEWDAGGSVTYAYQWQACDPAPEECYDIEDAMGTTYELTGDEVGLAVRVIVAAEDGVGTTSAASVPTAPVDATSPFNTEPPSIDGGSRTGDTLTADEGTWDGDGTITYAFQWLRCDSAGGACEEISGADDPTYVLTSSDAQQTVRVRVTATNASAQTEASSPATGPISDAGGPVLDEAPVISGTTAVGGTLEVDEGEWDAPPPSSFAYQWQRCDDERCANVAGATAATYVATPADAGFTLRVAVIATEGGDSTVVLTELSEVIRGEPFDDHIVANVELPTIVGHAYEGATVSADPGQWDADGSVAYAYQWRRCNAAGQQCEDIPDATDDEYVVVEDDVDYTLRVLVTAASGRATHVVASAPVTVGYDPSSGNVANTVAPAIAGDAVDGETLTGDPGTWTGDDLQYSRAWWRCDGNGLACAPIDAETGSTYELTSADVGSAVRYRVGADDGFDYVEVGSAATAVVAGAPPVSTAAPTASGLAVQSGELTADPGEWTGTPEIEFGYRWLRCDAVGDDCEEISGARDERYAPTSADVVLTLRLAVRATNRAGSADVQSAPIEIGPTPAPEADVGNPPTITAPFWDPWVLQASPGGWTTVETLSYEYQWSRCDDEGDDCQEVAGATDPVYFAADADVGGTVRVAVTATGTAGSDEAVSAPSEVITLAAPSDSWMPSFDEAPSFTETPVVGEAVEYASGTWSGGASTFVSVSEYLELCDGEGANCHHASARPGDYFPSRADEGDTLRVVVVLGDEFGHRVSAISEASEPIGPPAALANVVPPSVDQFQPVSYGVEYRGDPGDWTGAPELAAQWQRCDPLTADPVTEEMDCVDIAGSTNAKNHEIGVADLGFKLRLKVTATTPGDSETLYSEPSDDQAWVDADNEGERIIGPAVVGETITAESGFVPRAPLPVKTSYEFRRLNPSGPSTLLQSGDSPSYTIVSGDLGHEIRVEMTARAWRLDDGAALNGVIRTVTTSEVEGPPGNDVLPTIDGDLWTGATLTADPGDWHGGAGPVEYDYQWRRCDEEGDDCDDITGATTSTYELVAADEDATLRVEVTASHQTASGIAVSAATAPIAPASTPSSTEAPEVSGDPIEFETLTATTGGWDGDAPLGFSYQWQTCSPAGGDCADLDGATEQTLRLSDLEVGYGIRVVVSAANAGGTDSAASPATDPVASAPAPTSVALPVISALGPIEEGSTLATDGGEWEHTDTDALDYQWQRCGPLGAGCANLSGAEDASYEVTAADVGRRLRVTVTGRNSAGAATATSELSPVVSASTISAADKMIYLDEERETVWIANTDGKSPKQIADCASLGLPSTCVLRGPRISPNLKLIAIESRPDNTAVGEGTILLMTVDGGNVRTLTQGSQPAWSANGLEVVYTGNDGGATRIATIDADDQDGDTAEWLTEETTASQTGPDLSPDGGLLTYAGDPEGETPSGIYVALPDGSEPARLDLGPSIAAAMAPRFSADGTEIVFTARSDDESLEGVYADIWSVWAVSPDGSNLRRVTPEQQVTYDQPSVSGDTIYVTGRHWIMHFLSGGGSVITYDPAYAWTMHLDGSNAQPTVPAVDPDVARPQARPSCRHPVDCTIQYACEIRDCRSSDEKWRDAAGERGASKKLRTAMIKAHTTPPRDKKGDDRGWDAHHIVPAREARFDNAKTAEAIAWECGLRPNQPRNGVFLRGFRRHETQPGYKNLYPQQKLRQYHPALNANNTYYTNVMRRLGKAYGPKDKKCNQKRFNKEVHKIRVLLITGDFPIYHDEETP